MELPAHVEKKIAALLERWRDQRASGAAPTPEKLCADCPALLDEVRERIRILDNVLPRATIDFAPDPIRDNRRSPADLEADMLLGDFRIEKRLGAGGMGIVYRARQVSLDRLVALKVLGGSLRTDAGKARFQREAQAIARLKHPDIAAVHFIGQDDQICYMAMEYVDGVSLRDLMRRLQASPPGVSAVNDVLRETRAETGAGDVVRFDAPSPPLAGAAENTDPLSPAARQLIQSKEYIRWCVELVLKVATALAHAHQQGVIHRDVKPENLLVDQNGKVTVIDFGLARFYEDETITYTGQLVGTPLYMSPEQIISGGEVDGRTDVYSLGMVLHELLTLEPPLTAPNRESLFRQIVTGTLPPIDWTNPAVPADLVAVVHHALTKDVKERYASMKEFAADLERCLAGKAVVAPTYWYRLDENEIRAQRPAAVVWLAFFCFFSAVVCALTYVTTIAWVFRNVPQFGFRDNNDFGAFLVFSIIVVGIFVALLFLGKGLLSGRRLAWWIGFALGLPSCVGAAWISIAALQNPTIITETAYSIWMAESAAGAVFTPVLIHPRVRRWFRFAAETRAEFKRRQRRRG